MRIHILFYFISTINKNQRTPNYFADSLKPLIHWRTCYYVWAALNCTLILAWSFGTTGKLKPITNILCFCIIIYDILVATLASPSQTGAIGLWSWPDILKPKAFIYVLKILVFLFRLSISYWLSESNLYASNEAPTIDGAIEFENK
jgi:hypothetical protein